MDGHYGQQDRRRSLHIDDRHYAIDEHDIHHEEHHDDDHHYYNNVEHHEIVHHDEDEHHEDTDFEKIDFEHYDPVLGVYDMAFHATDIAGKEIMLHEYKGNVSLFVNVASQCGYTDQNYKTLQRLYLKYKAKGFEIFAFPCNDFGSQEPGSNTDIIKFARARGVTFKLMSKIAHINFDPLFTWLRAHSPAPEHTERAEGSEIDWNFNKFLVNKYGHVVHRFGPGIDEKELDAAVKELAEEIYSETDLNEHHVHYYGKAPEEVHEELHNDVLAAPTKVSQRKSLR